MILLIIIACIIAIATFVVILMLGPAGPQDPSTPTPAMPETATTTPLPAAQSSRMDPAFYEHIGPRPVVIPEPEYRPNHSPYVVDLSQQDALQK